MALAGVAAAVAQAGELNRSMHLLAMLLVMDMPGILWMKTVSKFFPSAIGDSLDILAAVYTTPT
jgi:hypothetical protein